MSRSAVVGVQVGTKTGAGAICVAETDRRPGDGGTTDHFTVRFLTSFSAGTTYSEQAARVGEVLSKLNERIPYGVRAFVNVTTLGEPVLNLFREQAASACTLVPAYFTHGDQRSLENQRLRLGKAFLVAHLQVLLQTARLHLPNTPEARQLAQELLDYEIKPDEKANEREGAFAVGTRDELVTALGLAVSHRPLRDPVWL